MVKQSSTGFEDLGYVQRQKALTHVAKTHAADRARGAICTSVKACDAWIGLQHWRCKPQLTNRRFGVGDICRNGAGSIWRLE